MKFFRFFFAVAVLSLPAVLLRAELIPASRLVEWTPGLFVGVPGGIDQYLPGGTHARTHLIDVTQAPYNADKNGVNDCHDAILSAINTARNGDVVYLPAGTYLVNSRIYLFNKGNFTIRGDGDATVIASHAGDSVFYFGQNTEYIWKYPSGGVAITSGLTKGSTGLTVADASAFSAGQLINITQDNDLTLPVVNLYNVKRVRNQKSRVISKTSSTITIFPGLYWTLSASLHPVIFATQYGSPAGIGIEDLKIDGSNTISGPGTILFEECMDSWVKNVHVYNSSNYHVYFKDCLQSEIRHCNLDQLQDQGSNGGGVLSEGNSACLFEDNIIYKAFPSVEMNLGCSGNVFAYNFCLDSTSYGMVGASIDTNHASHNSYNLYEGNIAANVECDGWSGGASEDTIFRNWLTSTSPRATGPRQPMMLKRFTRNYNVVGNILGTTGVSCATYSIGSPNIGNDSYTGTASLINSSPWASWTGYVAGTYSGGSGTGGFEEKDLDVQTTTVFKGNYNTQDAAIPAGEALGSDTLPNSFCRTTKPAFFGSLTWPAFDPTNVGTPSYDQIPAGYRYVHGIDPPGVGTAQMPSNAKTQIAVFFSR